MERHAHILWVDPPISPVNRRTPSSRTFRPLLSVIDDQLIRLTPVGLLGLSQAGVRTTTATLVRSQVKWALGQLNVRPYKPQQNRTDLFHKMMRWHPPSPGGDAR
jgi:hypothetical protein